MKLSDWRDLVESEEECWSGSGKTVWRREQRLWKTQQPRAKQSAASPAQPASTSFPARYTPQSRNARLTNHETGNQGSRFLPSP